MIMDCEYYKSHICEELEGAMQYAKAALELKASNPSWSNTFLAMCTQELSHAKNFYDMFTEYYTKAVAPYKEQPKYFRDMRQEIVDLYTKGYAEAKCVQEMAGKWDFGLSIYHQQKRGDIFCPWYYKAA